ncbi:hypothetical protein HBI56_034730 [Parastagonospora nodorum]|nr:hypothetical protein HBI13_198700 [Parastagonospora nodorum]KAH4205770.1 hypothetical protein HBI95_131120 [Parastagonospora nodorum]KAH4234599.1 hypothetical protein HBI05_153190 [Parastagonospora nodorum]KAH4242243.1 hypothetical protein HBI06_022970 [Parastagonospora nodorum]KAH4265493.1 hypothetical protein HBI03_085430 [Parastagonospora nodorum]
MKDVERRNFHTTTSPLFTLSSQSSLAALSSLSPSTASNACPLASNPVRLIKPAGATSAKLCTRDVRVAAYPTASAPPNEYPTTCADAQDKWSSKSSISPWNRPETCGTSGVSLSPWPQWSKRTMCALGK